MGDHDHYDPRTNTFTGPERRKGPPMDDIRKVTREAVEQFQTAAHEAVQKTQAAADKAQDAVMQIYADSNNLINSRFQHVDANIDKIAEDLKEVRTEVRDLRQMNETGHQHIIESSDRRMEALIGKLETVLDVNQGKVESNISLLVTRFEGIIENHDKAMSVLTKRMEDNHTETHGLIRTTNSRINTVEERIDEMKTTFDEQFAAVTLEIDALKTAKVKSDAEKWREAMSALRNGVVGAIIAVILGVGSFLLWGYQEKLFSLPVTPKILQPVESTTTEQPEDTP